MDASFRSSIALASFAAGALLAATAGGCAKWNWRGKDFGDNEGHWARQMRPPADEKQLSGLDARAQEIERNLGVR